MQTTRDLPLVIRLLPQCQFRDAQHSPKPQNLERPETHMHHRCTHRRAFATRATAPPNAPGGIRSVTVPRFPRRRPDGNDPMLLCASAAPVLGVCTGVCTI